MNIYEDNKEKVNAALKTIWDYSHLNQTMEKCDLIIGCGCVGLDIPKKCASLYKQGYAPKILFAGGVGKITKGKFNKPEAEIYKDIAIENGVLESDILIENESTNTGDNFRFALKLLKKNNIKHDKIIVVHKPFSERRTYSSAKILLKDIDVLITSPDITFSNYLNELNAKDSDEIIREISVIVGDVQRLIIYPQFGWQIENEVPENVLNAYYYLKDLGFSRFILTKDQIENLIKEYGLLEGQKENYFN